MYKPSELFQFLSEIGASPKKGLSQNFLIDANVIKKIIKASEVSPGDVVLEIGPGPGALTEALLQQKAKVIAIEKDRVLAQALERLKSPENQLEIHCADVLECDIPNLLKEHIQSKQKVKVIANLPYHVTTPILTFLVPMRELFSSLTMMVQDEVARRIAAKPGTKDNSSLTIFLNYYSNPKYAFKVSNNCFYPIPKVQSAVVVLELKEPPHIDNEEAFFYLFRQAFMHRRKMLRSSLKELHPVHHIEEALQKLELSPQARPELLSLEHWVYLYKSLAKR